MNLVELMAIKLRGIMCPGLQTDISEGEAQFRCKHWNSDVLSRLIHMLFKERLWEMYAHFVFDFLIQTH